MEPHGSASDAALDVTVPLVELRSSRRTVNGVDLHVVTGGDESAPLVVLLHGFPEFWYGWRQVIGPLVDAGYRVVVPDQRGYNRSEKPDGVGSYRLTELTRDVVELIGTEDRERAAVVGHDWGGMVAWSVAAYHPEVVDRLTIVNAPHPTAYQRQLVSNPAQLRRSWYALWFQLPWLPERVARYDDYRFLERALRETAAPGTFRDDELARYRRAWDREGALTAMLNWYRAAARYPPRTPTDPIEPPTLVVWGEDDTALVPSLAVDSAMLCAQRRLELLPETSHWVPHEAPTRLTEAVLAHLAD